MPSARGEYESVYGKISTEWQGEAGKRFALTVSIPANTTATIYIPSFSNSKLSQDGRPLAARQESGSYIVEIGSGSYQFEVN
jgi:hypothetical protein